MNQKDYKEIARIIKEEIDLCNKYVDELDNSEKLTYRAMVMREIKVVLERQAESYADYFEREDKELANIKDDILADNDMETGKQRYFNIQQFLKDCRVDER